MSDQAEHLMVLTTLTSRGDAEGLAEALVRERLAACVQVGGPVTSVYRWREGVERAEEWTCCIKTHRDTLPSVIAAIKAQHTYDVPEIVAVPLVAGSPEYLAWIDDEVGAHGH